ncbi:MAG TPA: thiol peroxidase [bacterium]|nr:thiol peroxidase [bacterium]
MTHERPNAVTLKGKPHTLVGHAVQVGQKAPDFTVISTDMQPITLASTGNKTRIFISILSVDTSVCDLELKTFAQRATELPNTEILVVSADLPFTLKRWCTAEGNPKLTVASDHKDLSFGTAYGVLTKELRTLARAVFVVNPANEITYVEYVPEISAQPNFDAAIQAAKGAQTVKA